MYVTYEYLYSEQSILNCFAYVHSSLSILKAIVARLGSAL